MFPCLLYTHCNSLSLHRAQIWTPACWLPINIVVCKPHISRAGEILRTYFWKPYCLMKQQNCVPHCLICHECHWGVTPIDLTVMTLVCSCVTTECAAKHNHEEVTVWMERVCSKFSIFVLFKKLAIWLTLALHLPTACLWFCTSQEVEPKNRCGWGQATIK